MKKRTTKLLLPARAVGSALTDAQARKEAVRVFDLIVQHRTKLPLRSLVTQDQFTSPSGKVTTFFEKGVSFDLGKLVPAYAGLTVFFRRKNYATTLRKIRGGYDPDHNILDLVVLDEHLLSEAEQAQLRKTTKGAAAVLADLDANSDCLIATNNVNETQAANEIVGHLATNYHRLRSTFVHEFVHYLDTKRIPDRALGIADDYLNNPHEFNAWTQEMLLELETWFFHRSNREQQHLLTLSFCEFLVAMLDVRFVADPREPGVFGAYLNSLNKTYLKKFLRRMFGWWSQHRQTLIQP